MDNGDTSDSQKCASYYTVKRHVANIMKEYNNIDTRDINGSYRILSYPDRNFNDPTSRRVDIIPITPFGDRIKESLSAGRKVILVIEWKICTHSSPPLETIKGYEEHLPNLRIKEKDDFPLITEASIKKEMEEEEEWRRNAKIKVPTIDQINDYFRKKGIYRKVKKIGYYPDPRDSIEKEPNSKEIAILKCAVDQTSWLTEELWQIYPGLNSCYNNFIYYNWEPANDGTGEDQLVACFKYSE